MGIKNRGVIKLGAFADLVLFDANAVIDQATVENVMRLSGGNSSSL
ncbi:hypothetical protein GPAL_2955 [Glaciecola pallidula DSM 14239 = ACAM 615]|uniref:Amidohydrolase 3 domain-containing protein n=1 Tax=Brumicola pallidula DSM 14239 = ACAM 615 TaxID=1121922 RepID=K6Z0X1_9ALTE|nr:hypothetical protein GPAL_2955 [Glaciecola pallidula DSM 14239 = ACAM 615]